MVRRDDFFEALRTTRRLAEQLDVPEVATVQSIRKVKESFPLGDSTVTWELRATTAQTYLVTQANRVSSGSFEEDLDGWTESADTGAAGASSQDTSIAFGAYGSMASLSINMSTSNAANLRFVRYQDLTVTSGDRWSFEWHVLASELTNSVAIGLVQYLGTTGNVIGGNQDNQTAVTSTFARLVLDGETIPNNAVTARVQAGLQSTAAGGSGLAYFDLVRAEQDSTIITTRATRGIVGESVVRS